MATRVGFAGQRCGLAEQGTVEGHPACRQQLTAAPAPFTLHQQADARQVAGTEVEVGGANEGATAIALPNGAVNAQRGEQRLPGVVRVSTALEHAAQCGGQDIAVATRINESLPGLFGNGP
ncbi:hypothetical protein D3C81_1443240 [compost metagenome]